jgi:hypothetical protein
LVILGTIETFCFLIYVLYIKLSGEASAEPILPVDNDQVENKSQQVKVPELEKQLELEQLSEDNKVEDKIFSQANSVVVTESGNFWHQFLKVKILDVLGTILPALSLYAKWVYILLCSGEFAQNTAFLTNFTITSC